MKQNYKWDKHNHKNKCVITTVMLMPEYGRFWMPLKWMMFWKFKTWKWAQGILNRSIFLQPPVQAHLRSPPPSGPHNPGLTPFMPPPAELRVLEQNLAHPPPALTRTTVFSPSLNLCKRITPHLRVLFLPSLSRQHSLQTGFVVSWIL